jgi:hypothetical protein
MTGSFGVVSHSSRLGIGRVVGEIGTEGRTATGADDACCWVFERMRFAEEAGGEKGGVGVAVPVAGARVPPPVFDFRLPITVRNVEEEDNEGDSEEEEEDPVMAGRGRESGVSVDARVAAAPFLPYRRRGVKSRR